MIVFPCYLINSTNFRVIKLDLHLAFLRSTIVAWYIRTKNITYSFFLFITCTYFILNVWDKATNCNVELRSLDTFCYDTRAKLFEHFLYWILSQYISLYRFFFVRLFLLTLNFNVYVKLIDMYTYINRERKLID